MAQASAAIKSARVYLNDINGISWTESILMPLLQEAFGELVLELERHSIPIIKVQTGLLSLPAYTGGALTNGGVWIRSNNFTINGGQDIVEPISMMEGDTGASLEDFIDVQRVTFLPVEDYDEFINYWMWLQEKLIVFPYLTDRQIIVRYKGALTAPQLQTDELGFIFAERYLGPRMASLAMDSVGRDGAKLAVLAERNLYQILQANVTNDQIPTRHRAYRSPNKGFSNGPAGTLGSV